MSSKTLDRKKSMKINKAYEVELNLRDLFFCILYKWRFLLLVGFIIGGIFGFKEYWSFEKYHRAGELTPEEVKYEAEVETNKKALEQTEYALAKFESFSRDNSTHEVSILMGIDPTNIWTAEKKYYLNVEKDQDEVYDGIASSKLTKKILVFLSEAYSGEIDEAELLEVFGTDVRRDVKELASISFNADLNTLSVVGCGATEEEAVRRKEFVDSILKAKDIELSKKEKYTLEVISDSVDTRMVLTSKNIDGGKEEKKLAEIQNTLNTNYQNYQNQVVAYTQTRNDLLAKTIVKPSPHILKQGLFGLLIGVILAIVICIATYLFNGKLKTSRELRKRYEVFLLGEFTHSRAWWKGKGIDWILEKLEFGKKTNPENELDSIAYLIDEAKDGKTLLLTGSLEEKRLKKIYDGLASRLQGQGIELVFEPDYLHNSEAVAASRDLDSVLLVEEKYTTRIRDLNRMAEMLEIEDANVIGAVLI